jgi:thiamine-monophosphate kinase
MKNKFLSEQYIINKYLKKLNFNKYESYNFSNDGAFFKIPKNNKLIVTNDTIIENVDFFKSDPPQSIANKIVTCNLSDISSMGAVPYSYTLSLCLPTKLTNEWLNLFTKSLFSFQKKFNFFLIGGDLSKSDKIIISSNFFGLVKEKKILTRSGAMTNDDIWVTGNLGESSIGLKIKKNEIKLLNNEKNFFIKKYLFPQHFSYGNKIVNYASSAIDISDGFYGDLSKIILESNKGASITSKNLPFSPKTKKLIKNKKINVNYLLSAGDDYELIFTSNPKHSLKIKRVFKNINVKISKVGRIIEKKGVYINNNKVNFINKSFDHFS